jgi:nucleotide-binding universal stress UspA family protein
VVEEDIRAFCGPLPEIACRSASLVVKAGTAVEEILRAAEDADLMVMGTHGRGGFERLFLGSVTEKVLRTTHRPGADRATV